MSDLIETFGEGKLLLIDKPENWTSFDVVKKIRVTTRVKKVGHAGTLDPLATGLLLVCTGKFTKRIAELTGMDKEYRGTMVLGAVTDSCDRETEVRDQRDVSQLNSEMIADAMAGLTGQIEQIPPEYSAVRVGGVRAYNLARKGKQVDIEPRKVHIYHFELEQYDSPVLSFRVRCSKGTYIRSLARDLGTALGCGAYLNTLRRISIGPYQVADAMGISQWAEQIQAQRVH